ncbi:MAG: hypothetical protein QW063_00440 [Candidatus Nanoarchaeia archaeon]
MAAKGAEWWHFLAATLVALVVTILIIALYYNIKSGGEQTAIDIGKKLSDLFK